MIQTEIEIIKISYFIDFILGSTYSTSGKPYKPGLLGRGEVNRISIYHSRAVKIGVAPLPESQIHLDPGFFKKTLSSNVMYPREMRVRNKRKGSVRY